MLREVELVEDEPGEVAPRPTRRRHRWLLAAAAIAVVALVVGAQSTLDHRHQAHQARFDDVPGVLLPVPEHLRVAWDRPDIAEFLSGAANVRGHLVAGTVAADHQGFTIEELDRGTGAAVWRVSGNLDPAVVAALREPTAGGTPPDGPPAPPTSVVVCRPLATANLAACFIGPPRPSAAPVGTVPTPVVTLDVDTGNLVSSRSTALQAIATVGDAVVTATSTIVGPRARATVTWSLDARNARGKERWRLVLPPVRYPVAKANDRFNPPQFMLDELAGQVLLVDRGHVWVVRNGAVVHDATIGTENYAYATHGGVLVITAQGSDSAAPAVPHLMLADGRSISIDGDPVDVSVHDGSGAHLVLVKADPGNALVGRDGRTGRALWSTPAGQVSSAIVLGGVVYLTVGNTSDATAPSVDLEAIDATTGHVRWRQPLMDDPTDVPAAPTPSTDGRALYVPWGERIKAFGIDDGAPLPDRTVPPAARIGGLSVTAAAGLLISLGYDTSSEVAAMRVLH